MIHFNALWCAERARKIMEPPMASHPQMVARFKLLNILPRATLERLSNHERPHMLTKKELVSICATAQWNLADVHAEIDRIFRRADPDERTVP